MDITARLQQIEEMVKEAKSMPLSSSVLMNREEMLELIEATRSELPGEITQARWVVKDREELLQKARKAGEAILQKARQEQTRIVSQDEVVRAARDEADRIIGEAQEQARQIRLEAEDYVDAKLAQFEIALEKTYTELDRSIVQVRRGRDRLRGVSPAEEQFGTQEELVEE